MEIPLDEVVYFDVVTHSPTTGAVTDADSAPSFEVFEENTDTDIGVGTTMTKRTSKTGDYRGTFTASAANGFELGKWYSVIVSATVSSIAAKKVAMLFRLVAAEATAGKRITDVDSTTAAAIADALLDRSNGIETGYTPRQTMRVLLSANAGKVAISGGTVTIRNVPDTKARITATVDGTGQRSAVTVDAT